MIDTTDEAEIRVALGHPEARSEALSGAARDRISLRDHIVSAEIGAFQQERGQQQRLRFNLVVDLPRAGSSDDVDAILSYDTLTEAIAHELAQERLNLLETLAARIAARILRVRQAHQVILRIEKLDRGAGALGVEILRRKSDGATSASQPDQGWAQPARVIHVPTAALARTALAKNVADWVDQTPDLILCVSTPPQTTVLLQDEAQRRIDLLAAAQSAWTLAAMLEGAGVSCTVTETRTELDWALKHGQPAIWSPVKMVLDAGAGNEAPSARDGLALAHWFATLMGAETLAVAGNAPAQRDMANMPFETLDIADLDGERACQSADDA